MTELHAQIDILEGKLSRSLVGAAAGLTERTFAVLRLMRSDGTGGQGEASPLPGYSLDSIDEVAGELQHLADGPIRVDPLAGPLELLAETFAAHPLAHPASRLAFETALLDWLGQTRGEPLHRVLGGDAEMQRIPIADLVMDPDPSRWQARADALISDGATHLKLKIGPNLDTELGALRRIREAHPNVALRLDGNQRISIGALRKHGSALESLELELVEEPVAPSDWIAALSLPLPFALDETLRDPGSTERLLGTGRIRAVVIKPMVIGGLRAAFAAAEQAASHGAKYMVSHTFDGPIGRAVEAELALALQTELAAGLGVHPALALWPPHRIAAIEGREIVPHDAPGLGLQFEELADD
jgi:L-alanine-DL-glutamate epimerase-like enolase superfamily enzyme